MPRRFKRTRSYGRCVARRSQWLAVSLFAAGTASPALAQAAPDDDSPQPSAPGKFAVDVSPMLGRQIRSSDGDVAWGIGPTILWRPSWLTVGAAAEIGSGYFGNIRSGYSVLGGTTFALGDHFEIDALAELGLRYETYESFGFEFRLFEETRVTGDQDAILPAAGIRLGPTFRLGEPGKTRFLLGGWLLARVDLTQPVVRYSVETCSTDFLFGSGTTCDEPTLYAHDVGGAHLAAGIRIGFESKP